MTVKKFKIPSYFWLNTRTKIEKSGDIFLLQKLQKFGNNKTEKHIYLAAIKKKAAAPPPMG